MKNTGINKPLDHQEPYKYKDLCSCSHSTVKDHDGTIPGVKESEKPFFDLWRKDKE